MSGQILIFLKFYSSDIVTSKTPVIVQVVHPAVVGLLIQRQNVHYLAHSKEVSKCLNFFASNFETVNMFR